MELFELTYFTAVARAETLSRAAKDLGISPAAVSKAIDRLESEFGTPLFERDGRGIRLTDKGRELVPMAESILEQGAKIRLAMSGVEARVRLTIAGIEPHLAHFSVPLVSEFLRTHPHADFAMRAGNDHHSLRQVGEGVIDLALTSDVPSAAFLSRVVARTKFETLVGVGHPLYEEARAGRKVPVETVLKYGFATFDGPLLGRVPAGGAHDGWRDDEFPRRKVIVSSSLKIVERSLVAGLALAYLPGYLTPALTGVLALNVSGCPFQCRQEVRLAISAKARGWVRTFFDAQLPSG